MATPSHSPPTPAEVETELTPEVVRGLQVLFGALPAGVVAFGTIVVAQFATGEVPAQIEPAARETARTLSLAHAVVAISAWSAASVIPGILQRGARTAAEAVAKIRSATILRLGLLEGPALMGWVVCLLAVQGGVLAETPLYWANALSSLGLLGYAGAAFPTRERLADAYRRSVGD